MDWLRRYGVLAGLLAVTSSAWLSCTWTPDARAVQPELLASGSFEVLGMLDLSRYAGFVEDPQTAPRVGILDLRNGKRCFLPKETFPLGPVVIGPSGESDPLFLWPAVRFAASGKRTLVFADETCAVRDSKTVVGDAVYPITIDSDKRQVLLFGDTRGKLSLYDPWNEKLTVVATGVGRFVQAQRPAPNGTPEGPQLLWLIENGVLTLRALDGTKVVARGTAVSEVSQAAFSSLRVAYVDEGTLYEAVAPDFKPEIVQPDACTAQYAGTTLSFFSPCDDRQLIRINLQTAQCEEFEPGVYAEWKQDGFTFERAFDEEDNNQLFVTPPNGERTQVVPTLVSDVQALDATRIGGRDDDNNFGIWSAPASYTEILKSVGRVVAFIDTRTNRLSWVAQHDLSKGRGTLSYLEQPSFKLENIAKKVASNSVSVLQIVPVAEPVLVYVRDATVTQKENETPRYVGSLDARVLSGDLGSNNSDLVTSYTLVADPNVPGLLYTTDGPEDQGLWFAAL